VTWAAALVLFKRSGESVHPLSLSLFKNVCGIALLAVTLAMPFIGEDLSYTFTMNPHDVILLMLSGIIGIALGDTILFYALNQIGVGLITIAECAYAPAVTLFAWLLLAEGLEAKHAVGGVLILAGLFLSSTHRPPPGRTRWQLIGGVALGMLAVTLTAIGIVFPKPILEETPLLTATMIRLLGGTVALAALLAISRRRRQWFSVFKPAANWRVTIPGSVLGTYLAMIFWIGGFKYTSAPVAAILNQTSTIFGLVFASLILKEAFTKRKFVSAALALSGVAIVMAPLRFEWLH